MIGAVVPCDGFQAAIVPPSVANINVAGPPLVNENSLVELNTCPVALPPGIATTSPCGVPVPSYKVVLPVTWFDTQNGVDGPNEIPHGFFRLASVWAASPETFDARFVCAKNCARQGRQKMATTARLLAARRKAKRVIKGPFHSAGFAWPQPPEGRRHAPGNLNQRWEFHPWPAKILARAKQPV